MNLNINLDNIKSMVEEAKDKIVPRTEMEKRMAEALSNKNWGASSTLMNQIAADTYDYEKYHQVMKAIWTAMDGPGKNWRAVFKALTLLDHLVKNGSERVVDDLRDRQHKVRTLSDFNYYEGSVDRGSGVRERAKQLVELLGDNERIREEREKARRLRDKFVGIGVHGGVRGIGGALEGYEGGGGGGRDGGGSRYDNFSAQDYHHRGSGSGGRTSTVGGAGGGGGGRYSDRPGAGSPNGNGAYDDYRAGRRGYNDGTVSPEEKEDHHRGGGVGGGRGRGGGGSEDSLGGSGGGRRKMEIRMKGTGARPPTPPGTGATTTGKTTDLLGDDFFGAPAAAPAPASFDPFAPAPTTTGAGGTSDGFDDFDPRGTGTATTTAKPLAPPTPPQAPAPSFDPFGAPAAPAAQPPYATHGANAAPAGIPPLAPPPGHGVMLPPPASSSASFLPPPPQAQQMPHMHMPPPQPSNHFSPAPQQHQHQHQHQHQQAAADFGDFHSTTAPAPAPTAMPPAPQQGGAGAKKAGGADMWGGLVDLGSLSLEERKQQLQQGGPSGTGGRPGGVSPSPFTELDAFAKASHGVGAGPIVGLLGPGGLPVAAPVMAGYNSQPQPAQPSQPPQQQGGWQQQQQQQQPYATASGGYGMPAPHQPQQWQQPPPQQQPQQPAWGAVGGVGAPQPGNPFGGFPSPPRAAQPQQQQGQQGQFGNSPFPGF